MATTFRKTGHTRRYTNSGTTTVTSGTLIVLRAGAAGEVGVAVDDIAAGAVGDVYVSGVHELTKASGSITAHGVVYRTSANAISAASTGNTIAGVNAGATTATAAGTIYVLLNGRPGEALND